MKKFSFLLSISIGLALVVAINAPTTAQVDDELAIRMAIKYLAAEKMSKSTKK